MLGILHIYDSIYASTKNVWHIVNVTYNQITHYKSEILAKSDRYLDLSECKNNSDLHSCFG
ncbi:hypothetical protein VIBNISOn1_370016 [Vibrio nigripulchritudo SOn1]|uniref:Uncharacterized protein n=1 Tax=Vibrio nigripulchritudo SOn1 TaxID=1238450 RepID=A0AAV2VT06_9VIBR|nr:hypothetical protein VIBNISFn118_850002 [Vibrio nigripulchritudo SFn118]CCO47828.1 hypothetical protein VIBNISOn1_370016 [Vibrio nigripulchritudo SOn1]